MKIYKNLLSSKEDRNTSGTTMIWRQNFQYWKSFVIEEIYNINKNIDRFRTGKWKETEYIEKLDTGREGNSSHIFNIKSCSETQLVIQVLLLT